ncbi:MAG: copper-binding protein [Pseudomonadota bacterium]|nr:copper-binding protein [Pseudomonadota bacterium]
MKIQTALIAAVLLAGCSQPPSDTQVQPSQSAGDMQMPDAQMPMDMADQTSTQATATGTVEAVNPGAGTITITHGPVAALDWPAMTMGFKASPEQLASVQAGQEVEFAFASRGMEATIVQIAAVK